MNALRCGKCDTMWHQCLDTSYVHGAKSKKEDWTYASWGGGEHTWDAGTSTRKASKSPRKTRRGSTPRTTRRKVKEELVPPMDPPWSAKQQPLAPAMTPSTGSTENAAAAQQLQTLVQKLQNNEQTLSPQEIQQIIAESTSKTGTSKNMHQAVRKVDQAREKLKAAAGARKKLHAAWQNYVEESIKRWQAFAEDFATKDAALDKEVNAARDALQEARSHLDEVKEIHSKMDADALGTEIISDGELDEDAMKEDTAEAIQKNICSVVDNLKQLNVRPVEEVSEEVPLAKKARTEDSGPGSRALSPFPGPGK